MHTLPSGVDWLHAAVDPFRRCHDHPDLFMVGAWAFLIYATANQTLGMAVLVPQAAGALAETLLR